MRRVIPFTPRGLGERLFWCGLLLVVTLGMREVRGEIGQATVALAYLLMVLGASARGDRRLGILLAFLSFLAFEYFFLQPLDAFALHQPQEWLVLTAFLVASAVASQLLHRAHAEAESARRRAAEVDGLAALGAETLNATRAEEAVSAITRVIRTGLGVERCDIYLASQLERAVGQGDGALARAAPEPLRLAAEGAAVAELMDGRVRVVRGLVPAGDVSALLATRARVLLLPLLVRGHPVGVLRLEDPDGIALDLDRQRFTEALAHHAALGLERVRLADERASAEARHEQSQTGQREAEVRMAESEERFRALFTSNPAAVISFDRTGRFTSANLAAGRITGHDPAELIGRSFDPFIVPEDLERVHSHFARALAGDPQSYETATRHLDGRRIEVSVTNSPILAGGEIVGVFGIVEDITERKRTAEQVLTQQAYLRAVIDTNPSPVFAKDREGRFTLANQAFAALYGLRPEELIGRTEVEFNPDAEQVRAYLAADREVIDTGVSRLIPEERVVHPATGETRWLQTRKVRFLPPDGGTPQVLAVSADITERKQTQEALRASEERYRLIFDANPLPLWIFNRQTLAFLMVNEAAVRQYGYTREEFQGLTVADLRPVEDLPLLRAALARPEHGLHHSGEWRHRRKDGSVLEVEIIAHPVIFDGNQAELVLALDVSDRMQAERALRESEHLLRTLIDAVPAAIILFDEEMRPRLWNPGAERLFGWSEQEVIGRLLPFGSGDRRDEFARHWARVARGETLTAVEVQNVRKDGTVVEVSYSAAPLRDAAGAIVGAIAAGIDITGRRALEQQLRQSQKMEAVGQLAGGIAHDFNNLLTVIKGNTELALWELEAENPLRADLEEIAQTVDRAANLTRQLLTFSRKQVTEPQVLEINAVVAQAEKLLRRVLGEHIELETRLDPAAGCIRADQGQMEQILVNLSVNARDAMPSGGRLLIATAPGRPGSGEGRGSMVRLLVSDTGKGIPAELRDRVFEPFFTTKPSGEGTGLGLSTVYGIVKQSGGEIEMRSELGQGTAFEIWLPGVENEATRAAAPPSFPPRAATGTILLVEDEPAVRDVARRMLERLGYTVRVAEGGPEALAFLDAHAGALDLVLTDVVMPGTSGQEVAERARSLFPGVQVLFMSGYTDEVISRHGVLDPGVEFIHKPFSPEKLATRVAEVMRGESAG